ncbi:peptidyl-tRNA hydrolase 2, mitochondrial-like isoform X2 [Limulus polyphemus]|uniref:peptidyl-tRNA hydrolase n=1 Tax=Limulus polyphemus TaxID=6850 RepID=A0ABM1B0S7_LIMPO|nr:peptidyl-tRNA hydrolase 2, mitochondrial-like isoform X2 [Limulus polyphemus]
MKSIMEFSSLTFGIFGGISMCCGVALGWFFQGRLWKKQQKLLRIASALGASTTEESFSDWKGECKLVLIVRNDLRMGKGKIAAQCSHASVLAYRQTQQRNAELLKEWEMSGQRKVVVKVDDEMTLMELAHHARKVGLLTSIVCDAGRTQIAAGSRTVLGIGPGPEELVDKITGHLKLL